MRVLNLIHPRGIVKPFGVGLLGFYPRKGVILWLFCTFGHLKLIIYLHDEPPSVVSVTCKYVAWSYYFNFFANLASFYLLIDKYESPNRK